MHHVSRSSRRPPCCCSCWEQAPPRPRRRSRSARSIPTAASGHPSPARTSGAPRWPSRRSTPGAASWVASIEVHLPRRQGSARRGGQAARRSWWSRRRSTIIAGQLPRRNVGLAVSDWAKQNKTMFLAAEPLTEALTWSKGHEYVVRLRPNTYEQGRMLAEKAGKMKHVKWATIGPNYEYGKRAWETFRDRLKELKPDVQVVRRALADARQDRARPARHRDPEPEPRRALRLALRQRLARLRREAQQARALPEDLRGGHPPRRARVHRPPQARGARGHARDGLSLVRHRSTPGHQEWVARYTKKTDKTPVLGSLIGYVTIVSIADAIKKAGGTETDKLVAAFKDLKVETPDRARSPSAPPTASPPWARGWAPRSSTPSAAPASWPSHEYVPGEKVLPSGDEVKKLRSAN